MKKKAADDDAPRSKTRVCIKNLPPSYSDRDLRQYLQKQGLTNITDCRVLLHNAGRKKSRRMAFCGFVTAAQAADCVERLHRSYCQTARLVVEYARLPRKPKIPAPIIIKKPADTEKDDDGSEEEHKKELKRNQRKQEFLEVMGGGAGDSSSAKTTSGPKFWANDDSSARRQPARDDEDDDDDDSSSKDDDSTSDDSSSRSSDGEDDADPLQSMTSDMDFLRSKRVAATDLDNAEKQQRQELSKENDPAVDDVDSSTSDDDKSESAHKLPQQETVKPAEQLVVGNRLFLRNLPFAATERDIREHFQEFGNIVECHVPADDQDRSKGFGFVTFAKTEHAQTAMASLDGTDFWGRLLHILPARQAPSKRSHDGDHGLSYKERMERKRQEGAASDTKGWSASYVRGDAVVDNLASRLGLRKGDVMAVKDGLSAGDAAVRLALGETAVIEENRTYFANHGVDMEALVSGSGESDDMPRSDRSLLVKNLPHDTTKEELLKIFGSTGHAPKSILLPPSRTIALVEYGHGNDAKAVFRRLAYRRFKSVPLYLEWAPLSSKMDNADPDTSEDGPPNVEEPEEVQETMTSGSTPTLYVTNLNFKTTEEELHNVFSQHLKDVRSVRIPRKAAPIKRKRIGSLVDDAPSTLSMGYGFVEFGSHDSAHKALKLLNGTVVDGHTLKLKPSEQGKQHGLAPNPLGQKTPAKLMVRNVPFQASRKELLQLFGSFGQLKKVRLPRKFDGTNRGFAFVEYVTQKEAAAAMKSLSRTHLYGRHLVMEWAEDGTEQLEGLREKAGRDIASPVPKNKKIRFT